MRGFIDYLKSRQFWKHLGLAILSLAIVLWILFKLLDIYTDHGETVTVPDFRNKTITELDQFVSGKDVRYLIIDSIYDPKEKPGIVLKQDPEANSSVKHNRTIYLYVTSMLPPQIAMPKLVDRSLRQAVFMIESYGLKVGKQTQVNGDCNGCILKQFYKGKEIAPGTPIKKGSVIDLNVGVKQFGGIIAPSDSLGLPGDDDTDDDAGTAGN
ncbi:MAG: PASTA domain-containing protein [Bacteroidetes bacterium]|nr:PASTA domain-containing protein [Bacteroidota bacterium]